MSEKRMGGLDGVWPPAELLSTGLLSPSSSVSRWQNSRGQLTLRTILARGGNNSESSLPSLSLAAALGKEESLSQKQCREIGGVRPPAE
eukprot:CAMPEP_0119298356 /NCGR_PEP_ID=MMETSP1333-20130426/550_1 /TAXON_ID=418940 /ORGANISM="Scyphosphaera apsteinii, Strain RCC1455" /LENGTH=88 /DNA_ID=CAMNT_0007299435 /DNA_START=1036 /DNA_END=1302 /DNA_ORIENTATION=+